MDIIRQDVLDLISKMRVLTLATCSNGGVWTAPVYYVYDNKRFYFFSNPDSKHIKDSIRIGTFEDRYNEAVAPMQVAASIFSDGSDSKEIKGLQMLGHIKSVSDKKDALLKAMEYIKKFKINVNQKDILSFFKQQYRARLYYFVPETLYFMDNSIKFGFRERIEL